MKMENKKKVRFNGIDVFIVVVAIAVIAGGIFFLCGRKSSSGGAASKNVIATAVLEVTKVDKSYADAIKVGDIVLLGEKDKMTTKISKVDVKPATTIGYDTINGRVLNSEIPNNYDIDVYLTAEASESENEIQISGLPIRVGHKTTAFGKGWSSEGYITDLQVEPE